MSFFDIVSEKVNEFLGGGVEEVANQIQEAGQQQGEDIVQQAGDVVQQVEEAKDSFLPGGDNQ